MTATFTIGDGEFIPVYSGRRLVAVARVSPMDYERVVALQWSLHSGGYVQHASDSTVILLHRFITSPPSDKDVDHKNHDKLDNRRPNLRVVTRAENLQNLSCGNGSSKFRGVCWDAMKGRWRATVTNGGQRVLDRVFTDEVQAALVAEQKRQEVMPFAEPDPELVRRGLL